MVAARVEVLHRSRKDDIPTFLGAPPPHRLGYRHCYTFLLSGPLVQTAPHIIPARPGGSGRAGFSIENQGKPGGPARVLAMPGLAAGFAPSLTGKSNAVPSGVRRPCGWSHH
jgi:hypothetical protein